MDGWMDGWMDRWIHARLERRMDGSIRKDKIRWIRWIDG
jgi:hypothetical protein